MIPVKLSGRIIPVKLSQFENAPLPMLFTPSGIVMLDRLLQSQNTFSPMAVTPPGIVMLVSNISVGVLAAISVIFVIRRIKKKYLNGVEKE